MKDKLFTQLKRQDEDPLHLIHNEKNRQEEKKYKNKLSTI